MVVELAPEELPPLELLPLELPLELPLLLPELLPLDTVPELVELEVEPELPLLLPPLLEPLLDPAALEVLWDDLPPLEPAEVGAASPQAKPPSTPTVGTQANGAGHTEAESPGVQVLPAKLWYDSGLAGQAASTSPSRESSLLRNAPRARRRSAPPRLPPPWSSTSPR